MTLKCDNHPERQGHNCSGWAVKRYLCDECISAMKSNASTAPSRFARAGYNGWEMFGGRFGITDSAYHNPNSVYERAQAQHTLERGDEK